MRKFLVAVASAVLSALSAHAASNELVVAAYGGAYTDSIRKNIAAFEQANQVKVKFVPASGADGLAKAKAKEVDVIHADPAWAARGEALGLFEPLNPAIVTNLSALFPRARMSEFSVAADYGQYGIAYEPTAVNPAPTSWYDMLDSKYKNRVSTANFDDANVELLVLFARLNGGGIDNIDPGFKKMVELSKNVSVFYSAHPQLLDLFRSGDVVMARWLRGRVDWAAKQGVNLRFAVPKEGAVGLVSTVHVVKGRPNTVLAMKFVNYLLSKECQSQLATDLGYTPARADLDPKTLPADVPYGAQAVNSLLISDWKKITPQLDSWKERWNKEVAR